MIHFNPKKREDVKSDEEWHMVLWLQEATGHGLVESWQYEPQSFELFPAAKYEEKQQLKTKVKTVTRSLHQEAVYTPDFLINFTPKGKFVFAREFKTSFLTSGGNSVYIDIKGAYNPHDQPRYFSIIQKAVYYRWSIWVPRIVPFYTTGKKPNRKPKGFFFETFAPAAARVSPIKKEINACGIHCKTIGDFINSRTDLFI